MPHPKPWSAASLRLISPPDLVAFLYHGKVRAHCNHRRLLVASVGWHGGPADIRRPLSLSLDRPRSPEPRRRAGRVSGRLGRRELAAEPQPDRGAAAARPGTGRGHWRRAARPLAGMVAGWAQARIRQPGRRRGPALRPRHHHRRSCSAAERFARRRFDSGVVSRRQPNRIHRLGPLRPGRCGGRSQAGRRPRAAPPTAGGARCLTADFDLAVNDSVINDMRAGHATRICWTAEGDRIYFLASGPGVTGVHSVDLEGSVREEAGGRRRIYDFDVASGVLTFCASDTSGPGELYMLTHGAEARVTDLNPWLHDRYVAEPEQHHFTAPDGWKLEGWVLKPPGHDPNRVYPTVLEIHGGPHAQYGWSFFHELQVLVGMGFVVFYMNPRGSDGYGERFRREVVRDWAGKDYVDIMTSLDQVIERTGYIDSSRLGVGGGSYGGYMTNWIIGQTDRFAAAVAMRSISNLVSEYSQHDIVVWGVLQLGPPPWPDLDELWRRSPIRYVQNIRTPLLLTAGEMDLRCAMSQSEEMFGAMRLLGKTVELVRFPEESHDLSRNGRPDRRVERLRRIAGWYERFLGTSAVDRAVAEETTQILPAPVEAARDWAKTIAITNRPATKPVEEPTAPMEIQEPVEASSAAPVTEPEVIQPAVPESATAEAPIIEPEALPDLPTAEDH